MSKYSIEGQTLTDIADAIRSKTGDTAALTAAAMAEAIASISGGGGASNIVMGEFTIDESLTDATLEIDVPYTGNGFPVAYFVYADYYDYYHIAKQYAVGMFAAVKSDTEEPNYSNLHNNAGVMSIYKSSASLTSVNPTQSRSAIVYRSNGAYASANLVAAFRSHKTLSLIPVPSGDSIAYGFLRGVKHTYVIIYSE